jgi:surfeit locus 1 family protein
MTSDRRARFPIGLTITVSVCLVILCGLGTWQVQRLQWKEGLLAQIAALQAAPARPALPALAAAFDPLKLDFIRVEVDCPGLATAKFVEMWGVKDGAPGRRLISACPLPSGRYRTLLVDRGFVDESMGVRPPVQASDAPVHVIGVLRLADKRNLFAPPDDPAHGKFYTRDLRAMATLLGAPDPAPVFLGAETATNPGVPALVPSPLPTDIPNNHLQYVMTWFGLAVALAGVYSAMLSRWLKTQ